MKSKFKEQFFDDKKKFYLLIAFFDWMLRYDFKRILQCIKEGGGYCSEYYGIFLSSDWDEEGDEEDENYFEDGVMFYELDEKIIIGYPMFVRCLQLACKIYMEEFGEDEEIKQNLRIIEERYADK